MTIQIELPKGWRIAQDDEPAVRYYGARVTNAPALPPPTPAVINHDTPCPLGCGRQVAGEGDEIHYCVTANADGSKSREYVGTWDGAAMFYGVCYDEVERQVRPYREEQQASELVIAASLLDGGDPDAVEVVEPDEQAATDQGFPWREQDQDELNVMEAACQEVLDSSLTTSLSLDGETTFVTHRSVEKRDEYLKANPDARIAFQASEERITMEDADNLAWAMRHVPLPNEERYRHKVAPTYPPCPACGPSDHHPQRCPQIAALLMPGPLPAQTCPPCGDASVGLCAACQEVGEDMRTTLRETVQALPKLTEETLKVYRDGPSWAL